MGEKVTESAIHKELDLIQGVVSRMAGNSFLLKGWMISIVAVILALTTDSILKPSIAIYFIILLPISVFWYLDAFFLSKERLYRELYKWVVKNRSATNEYLYDLNTYRRTVGAVTEDFDKPENSTGSLLLSKTLWPFYVAPIGLLIVLILVEFFEQFARG